MDGVRPARDIFVRVCNPGQTLSLCTSSSDWSAPVNLSNTANLSSISTDWDQDMNPETASATAFYGDSDKPNIFNAGAFAVVTWVDKYCPGGEQRMVRYIERDGITVPFSCVYVAYTNNVASGIWTTQRLTTGVRDAKNDSSKGLSVGTPAVANWAITWQEDPHGLQLGGADGPGEGASGASVTHGTDVWYSYTENMMATPWSEPVRVTDNYTNDGSGGNANPVFDPADPNTEIESLERGNTGAARSNLMLVAGSVPARAVIAYEESKGADRTDSGKFVRYHEFPYNSPPASAGQYQNGEPGCIISNPLENGRRVRFVSQSSASTNGLRMGVFWREGEPTEGGPADIMLRLGTTTGGGTGLRPEDMVPSVDGDCRTSLYAEAKVLQNAPAWNLSSNTIPWSPVSSCEVVPVPAPTNNLADSSSFNPYEDARAHRAAIVGDDLYVGYSYVKDWAVSTYTDMDNYNFWLRRYNALSNTWTTAMNISNIKDPGINVKEPRLVKTPGNQSGCTDPANITNLENCQDKNTLIVAWGTESNVYSHIEASEEFDIYYTRTRDKALSFEEAVVVPGVGENNRFESQLRPSPAGNIVYSVWNELDGSGATTAQVSVSDDRSVQPPEGYDLAMALTAPATARVGVPDTVTASISNLGPEDLAADAVVTVTGVTNRGTQIGPFKETVGPLAVGASVDSSFGFVAPNDRSSVINWTSTVSDEGDTDPSNNTATAVTSVRR
jgi:hypothetical protein